MFGFIIFDKETNVPLTMVEAGDATPVNEILAAIDKFENEVYCTLSE